MPRPELMVFQPLEVLPGEDRVLARTGCPPSRRGGFGVEAGKALGTLSETAVPRAAVLTMRILEIDEELIRTGNIRIQSRSLAGSLSGAELVSLFAVTIGPGPEEEARRLQQEGYHTASFFLDGASSSMVERLSAEVLRRLASKQGVHMPTARFAPGFGDFHLSYQRDIIELLNAGAAGITLQEDSCMLLPVKSGTGVIGWIRPIS